MIRTFESVTKDNFSEVRYLAANPDVERSSRNYAHTARQHFDMHGSQELRRQFTPEYIEYRNSLQAVKYERFRHTLSDREDFRWIRTEGSFPVAAPGVSYTADDYLSGESANGGFHDFIVDIEQHSEGLFIDIGCGVRDVVYENCLYVDVYPSVSADVVVGADCYYPFEDGCFDGLCCAAVLEHVKKPWIVVDEIYRILKPGGRCYIDWPFLQAVHGYPSHYYNATREGLRSLFAELFDVKTTFTHGAQSPEFSIVQALGGFVDEMQDPVLKKRFLKLSVADLVTHPPSEVAFWKPFVETLSDEAVERLACGNCLIGTKPA